MTLPPERTEEAGLAEVIRVLEDTLRRELRSLVREVSIELSCRGLVLRGTAYTFYGKQMAQQEVMRRCRLRLAANRIAVN